MLDGSETKGTKVGILVRSDGCKPADITILRDVAEVDPVTLSERNQSMDFLKARFKDLVLIASGADYGKINYRGYASDVEFLNLNAPTKEAGRQQ